MQSWVCGLKGTLKTLFKSSDAAALLCCPLKVKHIKIFLGQTWIGFIEGRDGFLSYHFALHPNHNTEALRQTPADVCGAGTQRCAEAEIKCPRKAWAVIVPFTFERHLRIQPCSSAGWGPSTAFSPVSARFFPSAFLPSFHSDPEFTEKKPPQEMQLQFLNEKVVL